MALSRRPNYGASVVLWLGLSLLAGAAQAGKVDHVAVSDDAGVYSVSVSAWLDLSQPELLRLLTDYERVIQANAAIKSVVTLPAPAEDITRLKAELEICVWFYCRALKQVQDMELLGAGYLQATMLPELSDYKSGHARWRMIAEGSGSRLLFDVTVEPDFWVPPLIGPAVIKHKLRKEAVETVIGIERLAAND